MKTKTAAYKRRNGYELAKARKRWRTKACHGIATPTDDGGYYRWFVDKAERDRVYALLRTKCHSEAPLHHKCRRNAEGEIKITTFGRPTSV